MTDALREALQEADKALAGMWSYDEAGRSMLLHTHFGRASEIIRTALQEPAPVLPIQPTGVGEFCQPGDAGREHGRVWLLRFDDADRGDAIYRNEAEARAAFAQAEGRGWNCYLFATAPRQEPAPVVAREPVLAVGDRCNWKGQPERLVYMGLNWSGNGRWHQFAKVDAPGVVWCEVPADELHFFERTDAPQAPVEPAPVVQPPCADCKSPMTQEQVHRDRQERHKARRAWCAGET